MKRYLIVYNLDRAKEDFASLKSAVKDYGNWARPFGNCWVVETSNSVTEVRSNLTKSVGDRIKILVVDITNSGWATSDVSEEVTDWLKKKVN